ncbi:MAG: hypothetical protein IH914_07475 [candidate division Zixibacteria bacterium]|nr:hypothetical protein [candidate division Zixibacteria bacterium]
MKKKISVLALFSLLFIFSCATIALDATSLQESAQLNDAAGKPYMVVGSFKVNDKAGWALGLIPANKPAGDNHGYFAEFLQTQIAKFGGDAVINLRVREQHNFGDILIILVTGGLYVTRTVTVSGDVIKYN